MSVGISDTIPALASLKYLKGQLLYRAGLRSHGSGATVARGGLENSVRYVERVVQDYILYGRFRDSEFNGMDVLEIGPGDTLGVAMLLLAKGAASVTCLDRFKPKIDTEKNRFICNLLFANLKSEEQARVQGILEYVIRNESSPDGRLIERYGLPVEQLSESTFPGGFDLIVSRAVLEHVYNLHDAWMGMTRVLKPSGRMLHKIDFRNHKFFHQVHPLYFLTVEEWFWKLLSAPDPTLNRNRSDTYESLLKNTCQKYTVHYTSILDNPELVPHPTELIIGEHFDDKDLMAVQGIRPRLAGRFKGLADIDLLVSGIFISCQR